MNTTFFMASKATPEDRANRKAAALKLAEGLLTAKEIEELCPKIGGEELVFVSTSFTRQGTAVYKLGETISSGKTDCLTPTEETEKHLRRIAAYGTNPPKRSAQYKQWKPVPGSKLRDPNK